MQPEVQTVSSVMKTMGELRSHLIDRATADEECRARLLSDPKAAVEEELGLTVPAGFDEEVPALLEKLQWPGPTAAAAEVLAAMDDLLHHVSVSLDVTARGLGPRLGLELYRPMKWFAAERKGWNRVITRVEERGWCLPAKAGGLRRWPGIERLLGGGETYLVRQGTSHVKVVVERGARTVAKAYAGMDVRPYDVASNLDSDTFAVEVAAGSSRANQG